MSRFYYLSRDRATKAVSGWQESAAALPADDARSVIEHLDCTEQQYATAKADVAAAQAELRTTTLEDDRTITVGDLPGYTVTFDMEETILAVSGRSNETDLVLTLVGEGGVGVDFNGVEVAQLRSGTEATEHRITVTVRALA